MRRTQMTKKNNTKEKITKSYVKFVKTTKILPTFADMKILGIRKDIIIYHFATMTNMHKELKKHCPKAKPKQIQVITRSQIVKVYLNLVKKNGITPTVADLKAEGISRDIFRRDFNSFTELQETIREENPKAFENIVDETIFTHENFLKLEAEKAKFKKFVVTTAVSGCKVNVKFFKALKTYCKKNSALLVVQVVRDTVSKANKLNIDPILKDEFFLIGDLALNSNLYISSIKISPKQILPMTGLNRLARNCSFIFGSPKQNLTVLPNQKHKIPRVMISTGAITDPDYITDKYRSMRTAHIATLDHKLGAIIVELETDDKTFYFRQLQAEKKSGNFVDLGDYYKADGKVTKVGSDLIKLGDWHAGDTDPLAIKCWKELCSVVKPDYLVLEDLFNGLSINHHTFDKLVTRAKISDKGLTNLKDELELTANDLTMLTKIPNKKCVVTYSNHDDFIKRYIESGKWIIDRENLVICNELATAVISGKLPSKYGIEKFMKVEDRKKVRWLSEDESWIVSGIENGQHGDKGANGARGGLTALEKLYGAGNYGHSHTPGQLRESMQAGTSTGLDLGYNKGGSSWLQSSIVQYKNGSRQLIHCIKGKWRKK